MKAVVQRVSQARVEVNGKVVGQCGVGLLVLVAAHRRDTTEDVQKMADRLAKLRIFGDKEGKMNLSILDLEPEQGAGVLLISNFTVYGETAKNRRPSFTDSAPYELGKKLFDQLVVEVQKLGISTQTGIFGADMKVSLTNDGPVTVILETGPSGTEG